jgi:polysaccharide export outer membrane protein
MKLISLLSVLILASTLSGCSSQPVKLPDRTESAGTPGIVMVKPGMTEQERLAVIEKIASLPEAEFTLGKGDVLGISVYNEPDLAMSGIPVRPDGNISFQLIGDITAVDKSVEQLRNEITAELSRFLKSPKVSIVVQQFNSQKYTIMGEIESPGIYALDTDTTLADAIARSGGLSRGQFHASTIETADLKHAFIARDGKMLPVDFEALLHRGDLRYNIALRPGDYVHIPTGLSREIYILGEVNAPDMFAFTDGMQLSKILVVGKGFTRNANLKEVHIIRGSLQEPELYIADLKQIFAGKSQDVLLQPGDIIYVPPTGLARWSDTINKLLPSFILTKTGGDVF